jgi:hypothetical protein
LIKGESLSEREGGWAKENVAVEKRKIQAMGYAQSLDLNAKEGVSVAM